MMSQNNNNKQLLSCFCQVFWSLQHKNNSRSVTYKFRDESAASSLIFFSPHKQNVKGIDYKEFCLNQL